MMLYKKLIIYCLPLLFLLNSWPLTVSAKKDKLRQKAEKAAAAFSEMASKGTDYHFKYDSLLIDRQSEKLTLLMDPVFSYIPFREENTAQYYGYWKQLSGRKFRHYSYRIETMGQEIGQLIPNFYRKEKQSYDLKRLSVPGEEQVQLIRNISKDLKFPKGLDGRDIALWHSHGWYYSNNTERWEWQRARMFQTVEDLWTMSFVVSYIVPMLENAGALVFLPRERDTQINEVIVDADCSTKGSDYIEIGQWKTGKGNGFGLKFPFLFDGENPFQMGQYRQISVAKEATSSVQYIPEIPETGDYSVSISYPLNADNISDARYTVFHSGGKTSFRVNQQMGGSTWIYLGTFRFEKGKNPMKGMVELTNQSDETGKIVSADAVKFGGGMGNIVRGNNLQIEKLWKIREEKGFAADSSIWHSYASGRPRFHEAARYYLQFAGMPDSLVYGLNRTPVDYSFRGKDAAAFAARENGQEDYKDDYMSRGEWINYLMGAPNGPTGNPEATGLHIPIDMVLAFHTDAGITPDSSIIGTLAIYDTTRDPDHFPNGQSKWANRDLCDIIQTQVTDDLKKLYEPEWTRRGMWNKQYSEAFRPKVPTMLSEFMSHQNFADMALATDSRVKFDVSRAYYKGILKFLSAQNGTEYVVQPLPVNNFSMSMEGKNIRLNWQSVEDPLESSAKAKTYRVYTRIEEGGFDNGFLVNDTTILLHDLQPNVIYSFKITAINEGGESFPSEILACSLPGNDQKPALIVNAFDRISAPATFDNGKTAGFLTSEDEGVAYHHDLAFIGEQYDFDRQSVWKSNDACGFGSCYADQETRIKPGNSFDYPYIHGKALKENGLSFISMSDEAFCKQRWIQSGFSMLDIIFGEEKTTKPLYGIVKSDFTLYTPEMRGAIEKYISSPEAKILVSGAYIGTDTEICGDSLAAKFTSNTLHFKQVTNHASKSGEIFPVNSMRESFPSTFRFVNDYHPSIYKVESPDAIEPSDEDAALLFRYTDGQKGAAVYYKGKYQSIAIGIPFETIVTDETRKELMGKIINVFNLKKQP